jgi:hypothetical protein
MKLYVFRTVHSAMVYVTQVCRNFRAGPTWSCSKAVYKPLWHVPLLRVQWINSWWLTEELSETGGFSCQNKFVKLVNLVGFIIKRLAYSRCGDEISTSKHVRISVKRRPISLYTCVSEYGILTYTSTTNEWQTTLLLKVIWEGCGKKSDGGTLHGGSRMSVNPFFCS